MFSPSDRERLCMYLYISLLQALELLLQRHCVLPFSVDNGRDLMQWVRNLLRDEDFVLAFFEDVQMARALEHSYIQVS